MGYAIAAPILPVCVEPEFKPGNNLQPPGFRCAASGLRIRIKGLALEGFPQNLAFPLIAGNSRM